MQSHDRQRRRCATPAYLNGRLYYGPRNFPLLAFAITNANLSATPSFTSAVNFPYPGTSPAISANGAGVTTIWRI